MKLYIQNKNNLIFIINEILIKIPNKKENSPKLGELDLQKNY